jgi:hypothetical protein
LGEYLDLVRRSSRNSLPSPLPNIASARIVALAQEKCMLDPRTLTHAQLADLVAGVQAILWQESRLLPDDPRQYGNYWNPGKKDDGDGIEQIAEILDEADLRPPDYMPVAEPSELIPMQLDAHELLWAARIFASLVYVHHNVIPVMRENVKVAQTILESYAAVTDSDPREQRWTIAP